MPKVQDDLNRSWSTKCEGYWLVPRPSPGLRGRMLNCDIDSVSTSGLKNEFLWLFTLPTSDSAKSSMSGELPGRICGFCGTGPFRSDSGLRRHITQVAACRGASQHDLTEYLSNVWSRHIDDVQPRLDPLDANLQVPMDIDDETLDDDIAAASAALQDLPTASSSVATIQPPSPPHSRNRDTCAIDGHNSTRLHGSPEYIECFPLTYKAGAGWKPTQDVYPIFDALCHRQEKDTYAPFQDRNEWELAQWLIKNVGQTQTEAFLKLPIVSVEHILVTGTNNN